MSESASHKRLAERIAPLAQLDPEDRDGLLRGMERLVNGTPLLSFHGPALREILQVRNDFGAVLHAKVLSETPGENHYDYCYPRLLHSLELNGKIQRGKTDRLIEPTSCNAGVSLAWTARLMGYQTEIVVPESLPAARVQRVREEADCICVASSKKGFIAGVQHRLRERMIELRSGGIPHWCPNHSEIDQTPKAFRTIGQEVNDQLPSDVPLDIFIAAIGNGTTVKGIAPVLQNRHAGLELIGFEDAGQDVTLIGAGGRNNVRMRYVDELKGEHMPVHALHPQDWQELHEGYNRGKHRIDTIGCTSAAALSVARTILEERKLALNMLVLFYDKADRYGDTVVTSEDARYLGDGEWSEGIQL